MMSWKKGLKSVIGNKNTNRLIRSTRAVRTILYNSFHPPATTKIKGIKRYGIEDKHIFFGYYDITPFDEDERYLLATGVSFGKKIVPKRTALSLGFFNLSDPSDHFHEIDETDTWCWQQGARLQWFPQKGTMAVLYNRMFEGRYGCVVQDIFSREVLRAFHRPLYAIDRQGRWGLSLNFSRLQRLRPGYGYANLHDPTADQPAPERDGIWKIDLETGHEDLLLSLKEISEWEPIPGMSDSVHYFNHLHFNPISSRFLFFHVWVRGEKRSTRLITANSNGHDLYPLINEGHVSHYTWRSENELVAYATHADTGTHYYLYRDQSDERIVFGNGLLNEDGHPSFSPDGSLFLTDTYPDRNQRQKLFLYDSQNRDLKKIGSFYSPVKYFGEARCDLHPRWSPSGRFIAIDSAHDSRRALYVWNTSFSSPLS